MIPFITGAFLVLGLFFFLAATVGFLRFPDFYTRMHATGKGETLGLLLTVLGLTVYHVSRNPDWQGSSSGSS